MQGPWIHTMSGFRWRVAVLAAGLGLLCTGCILPRGRFALRKEYWPESTVAVLPMNVYEINQEHYDPAELRELGNRVLDTLTRRPEDRLLGPSIVTNRLGDFPLPDTREWEYLPSDAGAVETPVAELHQLAGALRANRVILPGLWASRRPAQLVDTGGGYALFIGVEWGTRIIVSLTLVDLDTGNILGRSSGTGEAGKAGGICLFGLPVPIYMGNTWGSGINEAAKLAFERLFGSKEPQNAAGEGAP